MVESIRFDMRDASPLVLAYMGDAYIELLARETVIKNGKKCISAINDEVKRFVTAKNQSEAAKRIEPLLSEKEHRVFRQGLNSKPRNLPKSASAVEYMRATALECLFGYLYLTQMHERAVELFDICYLIKEVHDDRT